MAIIVQKYGGTSVANPDLIKKIAVNSARLFDEGNDVLIVLSAMAGETNKLLGLAKEVSESPNNESLDLLVSVGEQVSISMLSITLSEMGYKARPLLGWQVPIITDSSFGKARIEKIETENIQNAFANKEIVIVAGFQGVDKNGKITTLGRGGSDTTATALASVLKADRCDIYTDVEGVYTTDPRICGSAKVLEQISYEEMLEFADAGAKVVQTRAVEIAARHKLKTRVLSTFSDKGSTWIVPEEELLEARLVSGITVTLDEAKVAIRDVPDKLGVPAQIFKPLSDSNINVDLIIQNVSQRGLTDLSFTVPKGDLKKAVGLAEKAAKEVGAGKVEAAGNIAKLTVVGVGMRSHAGIAYKVFETLAREGIGVQMIGTSEIKLSMVIDMKFAELAVKTLHDAFGLGK